MLLILMENERTECRVCGGDVRNRGVVGGMGVYSGPCRDCGHLHVRMVGRWMPVHDNDCCPHLGNDREGQGVVS